MLDASQSDNRSRSIAVLHTSVENSPDEVNDACKMPSCNCGALGQVKTQLESHNVHSGVADNGPVYRASIPEMESQLNDAQDAGIGLVNRNRRKITSCSSGRGSGPFRRTALDTRVLAAPMLFLLQRTK